MPSWTKLLSHFILPSSTCYLCLELPPLSKGGSDICKLIRHFIQIKQLPGEEGALSPVSASKPLGRPSFISNQAELPRVPILKRTAGKVDWATLTGLRQIRTELPGPGIKPVSPETHSHGDEVNTLKCGRSGNEFGRGRPALNVCINIITKISII